MRTLATIDLRALCRNLLRVRRLVTGRRLILAIVKNNAYGHGSVEVARALVAHEGVMLGVAHVEEAVRLRQAGIRADILVLCEPSDFDCAAAVEHGLDVSIWSRQGLLDLAQAAVRLRKAIRIHLRIDTGLGPPGLPLEELARLDAHLMTYPPVSLRGLYTHLAAPHDDRATATQLSWLRWAKRALNRNGVSVPLIHAASSGAILSQPRAHGSLVRPGTMLYGRPRTPVTPDSACLEAALTWKTAIVQIRRVCPGQAIGYGASYRIDSARTLGVVPVGYGDGFHGRADESRWVLVRGRRVPVLGRPTMDTAVLDVSGVPDAQAGDEVILIGRQGDDEILACEVAAGCGMPTPEIWSRITTRVPRRYLGSSAQEPSDCASALFTSP